MRKNMEKPHGHVDIIVNSGELLTLQEFVTAQGILVSSRIIMQNQYDSIR